MIRIRINYGELFGNGIGLKQGLGFGYLRGDKVSAEHNRNLSSALGGECDGCFGIIEVFK